MIGCAWLLLTALAGAADFDHQHQALATFLDGAVTPHGVRYDLLASRRAQLDGYLAQIATAPVDTFTPEQQLALYVDAYNGYTLATVLDEMPVKSIMDIDGGKVWTTRTFIVGGTALTLDQIEHEHVRKLGDGRIHAVVNCASKGCPPLRAKPLTPDGIDEQLTAAFTDWVRGGGAYHLEGDTVSMNPIFQWFAADFTPDAPTFVARFAVEADRARLTSGRLTVTWADYDWSLNAAK